MDSPSLRYNSKVVIVTGGSKGIGEGCVRVFVRHGAKVAFCARGVSEGQALEVEMNQKGPGEAFFQSVDLTDEQKIKKPILIRETATIYSNLHKYSWIQVKPGIVFEDFVDEVVKKYGKIDCLINNAGQHPEQIPIDEISSSDFRRLFEVNVMSYFLMSKYCLPHLRKVKGNIINDSSLVAKIGQVGAVSYVATKGAIDGMTKALAIDEAAHGVRVNSFSPGNVWTPMWAGLAAGMGSPEATQAMIRGGENAQLLGRMGTIEESGNLCLWLAAEATFCTGIDINLSGGAELDYGNKNRTSAKDNVYN